MQEKKLAVLQKECVKNFILSIKRCKNSYKSNAMKNKNIQKVGEKELDFKSFRYKGILDIKCQNANQQNDNMWPMMNPVLNRPTIKVFWGTSGEM